MAASTWTLHYYYSSCLLQSNPKLLLSIASFTFFFFFVLFRSSRRSRRFPVNCPIVGMLPSLVANFHHLHHYISDALREAGFTFMFHGPWSFGMDFLVTSDPANVHHIFNTNFPNYPKGDDFTEIFQVFGGGLFGVDAESWRVQRKMAHGFIDRSFRSFVLSATRAKAERGLLPLLDRVAASGDVVDIDSVFSRVTFDITCVMVFGFDPGSLSLDFPTIPFAAAIDDFWEAVVFRHVMPKSWWKLLRRLKVGPEKKMASANEAIDHFIAQQISKKREATEKNNGESDLLSYYMNQPYIGEPISTFFESEDKFLRDTSLFLMIAGRDAFAIGLSWFFWLLSKNPDVEAKILDELHAHHAKGTTVFDAEELGNTVYLHGAVCEALRLFAPIPFEHKCAATADVLPSGHRVEAGMKILVSVYTMGRMEEIWGKDCMEFRPERWISETGRVRHVPAYKFMVFNSGPRSCLGKEIGLMQLKTVVAAVLWNFEVEVVEGQVVEPKSSGMIRMKNGMRARVKKRVM